MKNIKIIISLFLMVSMVTMSCNEEKETLGLSKITYFPEFNMEGEATVFIDYGSDFSDPGVTAEEDGQELTVSKQVEGTFTAYSGDVVDTNVADKQVITYSATNSDGFDGTATRNVWVVNTGDFETSLEGLYVSQVERTPGYLSGELQYILIWKEGDTYYLSDAIGGWYHYEYGYGVDYIASGMTFQVNDIASNDFTLGGPVGVGPWGGELQFTEMSVDQENKQIFFTTNWVTYGYTFEVTLTQVEL